MALQALNKGGLIAHQVEKRQALLRDISALSSIE